MSLLEEAQKGRLEGLQALRDKLASELDGCDSSRDVAALSRQFTDVLAQIQELTVVVEEKPKTALDELRKRREERAKKTG